MYLWGRQKKENWNCQDKQKVLEFLMETRKQALVAGIRNHYVEVMEIVNNSHNTVYFFDQREVVHVRVFLYLFVNIIFKCFYYYFIYNYRHFTAAGRAKKRQ